MLGSTEGWAMIIGVFALAFLFWAAVVLGGYILNGIALFRLAKNAGLPYPGLAWVPIASTWLLGTLCDRSQEKRTGRKWRFAVLLPVLEALTAGCGSLFAGTLGFVVECFFYARFPYSSLRESLGAILGLTLLGAIGVALYQLYLDYAPGAELPYTILSVIFGGVGRGIFLMVIRNKPPVSPAFGKYPSPPPPAVPWQCGPNTTGWDQPPRPNGPDFTNWNKPSGPNGPER